MPFLHLKSEQQRGTKLAVREERNNLSCLCFFVFRAYVVRERGKGSRGLALDSEARFILFQSLSKSYLLKTLQDGSGTHRPRRGCPRASDARVCVCVCVCVYASSNTN